MMILPQRRDVSACGRIRENLACFMGSPLIPEQDAARSPSEDADTPIPRHVSPSLPQVSEPFAFCLSKEPNEHGRDAKI
jgi:hypothetical protein